MASLSAHLRQTEAHGRLAFHPECPICRAQRLSGTLLAHSIVGQRTQAALVAVVLAASTAAPAVAVGQEPDQVSEGTVAPEQADDPDFDPGGESDDLPFDAPDGPDSKPAQDPELGDPGPSEQEPTTDVEEPVADAGDETVEPGAVPPAPVATVTPAPSPTPPAAEAPDASAPPSDPGSEVATPQAEPRSDEKGDRAPATRHPDRKEQPREQPSTPAPVAPAESVATSQPAPVVAVSTRGSVKPGDRVHVVLAGESLWSIAGGFLGKDASPALIAREVNRLWELNSTRIATGDPDLLMVGTRLTLR